MSTKKRFFIYNSWQPTIELLTTEEKAEMLMNFFRYQNKQDLVLNTSGLKMAWVSFQYLLDTDNVKYEAKRDMVATNRAKRNINGNTNTNTTNTNVNTNDLNVNTTINTNASSDNVNVNGNVKVNDNVNGNVNGKVNLVANVDLITNTTGVDGVKHWIRNNNFPPTSSIISQFPEYSEEQIIKLKNDAVDETLQF